MLFAVSLPALSQRSSELLNFGWKFHAGDVKGGEATNLDDSGWREVNLPHDYQIEQPWIPPAADEKGSNADEGANIKSRLSSRGFKEMGTGWYRKHFTPADSLKGRRILVDVEGIMLVGDLYLNGERIGGTDYGYLGFDVDISKKVKFGQDNVLAVKADTGEPENSRWYTGGGLYRDVHFVYTNPRMYFTRHPLQITSDVKRIDGSHGDAEVRIQAEVNTLLDSKTKTLKFQYRITDPSGNVVADKTVDKRFYPKQKTNEYVLDTVSLNNASLWSCETPSLYTVEVSLFDTNGNLADNVKETFGIRKLEFSPAFGMKLNGKKVLLKGIANHHTLGALGASAYERAIEKRLKLLKDFGFNHIRTSHNPYSESLLRLCDQYGILVVDELYDKWLDKYCGGRKPWAELWQENIPEFIKRDRNHPSVVVWSLGNELQTYWNIPYADWGVTPYRMQKQLLLRYDDSRLITVAMHPRGRSLETDSLPAPLVMETDIAAYNYRYMYFPGDGRKFPWMMFYQSEATTAAMGPNYYEMDLSKVIGLAYWGAIDYLGESQGWPAKGWAQGVFYIDLTTKPNAYLAKSIFKEEPTVHLCFQEQSRDIEWNGVKQRIRRLTDHWTRTPGEELNLTIYTNADEVELVMNGRSLGRKQNDRSNPKVRNQIRWDKFNYEPGYIEAIARNAGKIVARHREETAGPAVALRLTADNAAWKADGIDLQHIRVEAIDKKGRLVPLAHNDITFSIEGDASLTAVSSGDHYSDELTQLVNHRRLYEGSCMAILRAGRTPSTITLTATATGLKAAKLKMTTVK